jgi:hypothetical protein
MSSADPFRFRVSPAIEFNESQLETLKVILDTFIAPLSKEQEDALVEKLKDTHTENQVRNFCQVTSTSLQSLEAIKGFINRTVLPEKRRELLLMLSLLSSRAGTFALTGYLNELKNLSLEEREQVFLNWKNSFLPQLRLLYKTFHSLSCHPAYSTHADVLGEGMHYADAAKLVRDHKYDDVPERLPMLAPEQITDNMKYDVIIIGSGAGGGK